MRALLLLIVVASAGCLDTVLPDPVLPKELAVNLEYVGGQEDLEGIEYAISVHTEDGEILLDESGVLEPGLKVQTNATFETLGPYTLDVSVQHPQGPSFSRSVSWDFEIVCRAASVITVDAVFEGDSLDLDASSDGKLCV